MVSSSPGMVTETPPIAIAVETSPVMRNRPRKRVKGSGSLFPTSSTQSNSRWPMPSLPSASVDMCLLSSSGRGGRIVPVLGEVVLDVDGPAVAGELIDDLGGECVVGTDVQRCAGQSVGRISRRSEEHTSE